MSPGGQPFALRGPNWYNMGVPREDLKSCAGVRNLFQGKLLLVFLMFSISSQH